MISQIKAGERNIRIEIVGEVDGLEKIFLEGTAAFIGAVLASRNVRVVDYACQEVLLLARKCLAMKW